MDRKPHLSLDLLRGFRAAARHLSFTQAARELFVTQSAISREIKTLEAQLGQALFHRVNRTLQLTLAGEQLYRATDDALALIDMAAERIAGTGRTLGVTTTTALASLWLVPRLRRFTQLHPDTDVRIAASNAMINLERESLDLALRYVPPGWDIPEGVRLVDYEIFPVCSPALLRDPARPLRTCADLERHVLLDYEALLYGRTWYDWEQWFDATKVRKGARAGTLRFSHYDQVVNAAMEGAGVAIGKRPHLTRHLRDGDLVAPFGSQWVAQLGGFDIVVTEAGASRDVVRAFAAWLRSEVELDAAESTRRKGHQRQSQRK